MTYEDVRLESLTYGFLRSKGLAPPVNCRYSPAAFPADRFVTDTRSMPPARLSTQERIWLAALGVALASLLGVAAWLDPSPNGMGTHQQLGLPPCTFVWLFGTRCPSCGMTTAWSHAVRGQWLGALKANVGGMLLAVVAMAACPWALASAVRARWLLRLPREETLAGLVVLIAVVTLGDWIYRLAAR